MKARRVSSKPQPSDLAKRWHLASQVPIRTLELGRAGGNSACSDVPCFRAARRSRPRLHPQARSAEGRGPRGCGCLRRGRLSRAASLAARISLEIGIVLSVVHFNHQLRGTDSDADEQFVADLAGHHKLELHLENGDTATYAKQKRLSIETAARELRYQYLRRLLAEARLNRIATAHTLDDQAETVLLRIVRGAGSRGLAGIYPQLSVTESTTIVRPLLATKRKDLERYLKGLNQPWREDASNRDLRHARNRVRHGILPRLERFLNPAVRDALADTADIARAEEDYWQAGSRTPAAASLDPASRHPQVRGPGGLASCSATSRGPSRMRIRGLAPRVPSRRGSPGPGFLHRGQNDRIAGRLGRVSKETKSLPATPTCGHTIRLRVSSARAGIDPGPRAPIPFRSGLGSKKPCRGI